MACLEFRNVRWHPSRLLVVLSLCLACAADAQEPPGESAPFSLGVAPSHSLVQLEGFYAPLAQFLGESLGRSVRFGTSSSYERFTARLAHGDFDIVLVQSADLRGAGGYTPLLRFTGGSTLLIIAKPDSALRSASDLRGKTLALPPAQFESTPATLERLRHLGIDPDTELTVIQVAQHNACLQYVASGRATACATTETDLRLVGAQEGVDYMVLDRSPHLSPLVFATGSRIVGPLRELLARALMNWPAEAVRRGVTANGDWLKLEAVKSDDPVVPIPPASAPTHGAPAARRAE